VSNLTYGNKGGEGWRTYFSSELRRLGSLVADAGGYGPQPPPKEIVELANQVVGDIKRDDLPRPFVIPGSDGSIQLKWRNSSRELSFFICSGSIEYLTVEPKAVSEGDLQSPTQLNEFVDWLLKA
jgi:hypothetical protein